MDKKTVVENIKRVRLGLELSLGQLAKRSGLTKGYLPKIENSHKAPPDLVLFVPRMMGKGG